MSSKLRPIAFWAAVGFGIAAGYCAWVLNDHRGYRVALDHAGGELPERLGAIAAAPTARDIVAGYQDFLAWDSLLVPLLLLVFVFVAWYARLRSPNSSAPKMLVAAAVVYALSEWAENWMLGSAAADVLAGRQPSWLAAAAVAEWAKWLSFSACVVLVPLTLLRGLGHRLSWARVLFLDMPAMVDDVWRRLEFRFHRETHYDVERTALKPRPWWQKTPFWLFSAVTLFVAYGPTLDGLCSASPAAMEVAVWLPLAALLAWAVWIFIFRMGPAIDERVHKRFDWLKTQPRPDPLLGERASIASFLLNVGGLLLVAPAIAGAITLGLGVYKFGWCGGVTYSGYSLARLGLWVLALAAFAYASSRPMQIRTLLQVQALLVAAVAIGTWLVSPAGANEASGHPYVHVFLVIAPVVCVLLCLTPGIAERRVRRLHGKAAERFSAQLPEQELFVKAPDDPVLNLPRVMHALTHGFTDRLLQLLIPPALLALVAPADWLPTFTIGGLLLAVLLSTWGNMSTRWQHMALDLQRWFLQGTAYFVSLFVIVLAGARLLGVDYVTTILNAAPLGVVFGMVLMAYALSWLVEYWINRVVAAQMLEVLGAEDGAVSMSYPVNPKRELKVDVQRDGRYLMIHSIGRFAVVGRMQSRSHEAFHSYDLLDLFRTLAVDKDDASVAARQADLYFHSFNLVLVLLAAACWLAYAYGPRYTAPAAVVEARAEVPPEKHFDLAERLLAPAGDSRPALVLAASGGGTRAALYTAHVLEGLHRLGAAGDIALMSGVSGGGVALAYFAANREALVRAGPNDKAWQDFRRHITDPFIEDVLEGSTELRVYRAGSVSMLLAESFKRRLAQRGGRWSLDVQGAGLILNTAISGHPAAESELLERTLNDADDGRAADCKERDRPYRLMGGGRLVFTNLKQTSKFPQRDNRVPDVRLPYVLVRDPAVPLEKAAALNANFPPAFPNARVLLRGSPGAACPDRTFFVTDGGAQENLGLVSALYAVQSALDEIGRHCGKDAPNTHPWCKRTLRPIHFVIAEASAATFDYEEDRGISTALTAKERLTGGLTGALIERNQELYLASGVRAGAEKLDFYFLGLPLVFRARGGLGTHWMHAARVEMIDPRLRVIPAWYEPSRRARATVTVTRANLDKIWLALHDPAKPYCSSDYSYGDRHTDTVRRWICGSPGDSRGSRDLHIKNWADLRAAFDPGALQPKRP